jgi:hypothetical protein
LTCQSCVTTVVFRQAKATTALPGPSRNECSTATAPRLWPSMLLQAVFTSCWRRFS